MQGECPLPYPVIEKFASTQGEIAKNVFLLSAHVSVLSRHMGSLGSVRQIGDSYYTTWLEDCLPGRGLRRPDLLRIRVSACEFIIDTYYISLTTEAGFLLAVLHKTHH